jgi:hypothetical protein
MSHDIRIHESGVVEIVHTGEMTIKEATESRDEAGAIMNKRGLRHVLADVSQTRHSESTVDLFEFNSTHYDVFPQGTWLAVVIPPGKSQRASAEFAETVAVNRGIAMKIFMNRDSAFTWLGEQKGDPDDEST